MDKRMCLSFAIITTFGVMLILLIAVFPKVFEVYRERQLFLENQFEIFDEWNSRPLTQQQRFYFYNITNVEEFLLSSVAPMKVEEIGPFVYNVLTPNDITQNASKSLNYLSSSDLKFLPNASVASDSSVIYTLNIPLIRTLYKEEVGVKINRSFKSKTLLGMSVRNVLREIIDGHSLQKDNAWTMEADQSPLLRRAFVDEYGSFEFIDKYGSFEDLYQYEEEYFPADSSNNAIDYFTDGICAELFGVFRMVNAPVSKNGSTLSGVFQGSPCKCLKLTRNGIEMIKKTHPANYRLRTRRYILSFNGNSCAGITSGNPPARPDDLQGKNSLFSVSAPAYFEDIGYIQNKNSKLKIGNLLRGSHINVDPVSDTITDMIFRYQFNVHITYSNDDDDDDDDSRGKFPNQIYPVLLIEIYGKSTDKTDRSIYRYIVFPHFFTHSVLMKALLFALCVLVSTAVFTFLFITTRGRSEENEATPLLNVSMRGLA